MIDLPHLQMLILPFVLVPFVSSMLPLKPQIQPSPFPTWCICVLLLKLTYQAVLFAISDFSVSIVCSLFPVEGMFGESLLFLFSWQYCQHAICLRCSILDIWAIGAMWNAVKCLRMMNKKIEEDACAIIVCAPGCVWYTRRNFVMHTMRNETRNTCIYGAVHTSVLLNEQPTFMKGRMMLLRRSYVCQ